MTIQERLTNEMKDAMRAKDTTRLGAIRMAIAAIKEAEISRRPAALSEEDRLKVIAKAVKMRREAAAEFRRGNRPDLAAKEEAEAAVLEAYLPAALTDDEIRALAEAAAKETGAVSAKEIGKVMKAVMPRVAGRADGAVVQRIVREILGG